MWSMNTNKYLGGFIVVAWLLLVVDFVGDQLIPPMEPVVSKAVAEAVSAKTTTNKPAIPEQPLNILLASANLDKGKKVAKKCVACHSFNPGGKNKVGPNLWNILNQSKASKDGYSYSKALKEFGGEWDYQSLNAFLLKPKNYINGTKMNFSGLKKTKDRANIIAWLRSLSDNPEPLLTEEEIKLEADDSSS